jgi:hypothetical protein
MAVDRASGVRADSIHALCSARWAIGILLHIESRPDQLAVRGHISVFLCMLDPPDLFGRLDLREVLDAKLLARSSTRFDKVRQGKTEDYSQDRDDYHQFDQGKPLPPGMEPGVIPTVMRCCSDGALV